MNGEVVLTFADSWVWLFFIIAGLLLALLELVVGVDTGLDLVFIGSAFLIGGFVGWPFHSWLLALIITSIICITYIALGRRYIHRWTAVKRERTNIDAIIGTSGIVVRSIAKNVDGLVKVRNEQWRAKAEEDIEPGEEIIVKSVSGVTLIVEKRKGGD
jgi:membrane protein implicated in regulation of membrane protease activity